MIFLETKAGSLWAMAHGEAGRGHSGQLLELCSAVRVVNSVSQSCLWEVLRGVFWFFCFCFFVFFFLGSGLRAEGVIFIFIFIF